MAPHIKIKAPRGQGQQRRRRYAVSGEVEAAAARAAVAVEASQIADALLDRETAATAPTTSPAVPLPAGVQLPFPTGPAVEDVVEEKEEKEGKNKPGKAPPGFPTVWKIVVLVAAFFWLFPRLVTGAEVLQTASGIEPFCASTARFVVFKHVQKMAARFVPRPGPANLGPNSGLDEWLEEAKQCHYLPESVMKELCEKVKEVLMEESNIQPVCTPVTVCGDIHGQFYDLLELFRVSGGMPGETQVQAPQSTAGVITSADIEPPSEITNPKLKKKLRLSEDSTGTADEKSGVEGSPEPSPKLESGVTTTSSSQSAETRYIFLGDFVDRGYFSLETFTLLMCLKAKYPDKIVLVRGNHESRQITQVYGFYEECQQKYGNASVWKACCHVFDFLVLAAIVDGEILCVHGGLSPEIRTIDQIRVVARAQEIPHEGAFCDLVWSDPEDVDTWAVSPRGAGWLFGDKVATEFNQVNGLKLIARAHQLVNEGYKYHFPENSVVTVWSAPNYCYRCGNVASIMSVEKDLNPTFSIFAAVPDEQRHVPPNRRGPSDYFL